MYIIAYIIHIRFIIIVDEAGSVYIYNCINKGVTWPALGLGAIDQISPEIIF